MKTFAPRRGQPGFTLIELLVVIVILGILSAVVVFAVRGADDKGKAAAVAIDERTIRTAMETFCAQRGHYPGTDAAADGSDDPMTVLVAQKFLSEPSTYHGVALDAGTEGNCNNQKYRFIPDPTISTSSTSTIPAGPPVCGQPDSFCDVIAAPQGQAKVMVSLPNGKVLAFECLPAAPQMGACGDTPVDEYDPNDGQYGAWSRIASGPPKGPDYALNVTAHYMDYASLIKPGPGSNGDCLSNCNKVLVHFWNASWWIFDPNVEPPTWTDVTATSSDPGFNNGGIGSLSGAAQILGASGDTSGNSCGTYCGKFLVVYERGNVPFSGGGPIAEFFDPRTGTFSPAGFVSPGGANARAQWTAVAPLKDGRILIAARDSGMTPTSSGSGLPQWTRFFNPASADPTAIFQDGQFAPTRPHTYRLDPPIDWRVLANGDVLWVTGGDAEVFGANGAWRTVESCLTPNGTDTNCQILTAFGGGSALAVSVKNNAGQNSVTGTWRFDPLQEIWIKTGGEPTRTNAFNAGALIGGDGCTGLLCGKVITAGANDTQPTTPKASQLYSPPSG